MNPNGQIKIETGVPIPDTNVRGIWKCVFEKMNVGDSFLVTAEQCPKPHYSLRPCASHLGFKIKVQTQTDGSARVWRTA